MTMFACFDFDNFAFIAVDRRVSRMKLNSKIVDTSTCVKLLEHNDFFITGYGLQEVIKTMSKDYVIYKNNNDLYSRLKLKNPKEFLDMTKVVMVPKNPVQGIRIMVIDFSKDTFSKALEKIDGTMEGSKFITESHHEQFQDSIETLLSANAEQNTNKRDFQVFIASVSSIFSSLANLTDEVSAEFDYLFMFDDGKSYLNELPE
ncbi:hypothetical protein [Paraglaciecola sp. 20A4]|uniref:hypothetical protein n=1 Tax=Paraglaciecola sp. 20A4 TaxID=2687288 RepID=UPI001409ED5D|nr:hypothetical protein [Paraglaciecola sp. 20A4]